MGRPPPQILGRTVPPVPPRSPPMHDFMLEEEPEESCHKSFGCAAFLGFRRRASEKLGPFLYQGNCNNNKGPECKRDNSRTSKLRIHFTGRSHPRNRNTPQCNANMPYL